MALSPKDQDIIRSTWAKTQQTDAALKFYDTVLSKSPEAADVFKRVQIRRIFNEFDENSDGSIQLSELEKGIKASSNEYINKEDLLKLIQSVDVNKDEQLDIEEFTVLIDNNPGAIKRYDMSQHGAQIFAIFGRVVAAVDDLNTLLPVLKSLGSMHVDYGVDNTLFPAIGKALMAVLADALGSDFTEDVARAWGRLYDITSSSLISGLAGEELTKRQKDIIKSSWAKVGVDENASENFYNRLFLTAPSSAELFRNAQVRRIFKEIVGDKRSITASQLAGSYSLQIDREKIRELLKGKSYGESISLMGFRFLVEENPGILKDYNAAAQGKRIFDMITVVVNLMDDERALYPVLSTVGRRHAAYGVSSDRFAPLGETLIWTITQSLGSEWNTELEDAWRSLYRLASTKMIKALNKSKL